jgi:hypothetical protein
MPDIGRWTQSDPLLNDLKFTFDGNDVDNDDKGEVYEALVTKLETANGIYNTNNLNPYGYGYNNPVYFDDPDGRCPWCIVVLAVYLLTPETVIAPTGRKSDGKAIGDSKAMKGNVLLSASGAGLAAKIVSGSKSTPAKEKAVEKAVEKVTEKAVEKRKSESNRKSDRTLKDPLRRDKNGNPKADPEAEAEGTSHTQLGTKQGRKGEYKQGREFDKDGKAVKDIDHGRPSAHPDNPHQHRYIPNSTGGTPQRSKIPEPISFN